MEPAPIRTLVVDDEPAARKVLGDELGSFLEVEVVGEASDGNEALIQIAKLHPQLVFLDLQMPGMNGFDVVRSLSGPDVPVVVIVTAFDQHAIEAFEAGAVDYLLKPVSAARLRVAVDRARILLGKPAELAANLNKMAAIPHPGAARTRRIIGRVGEEYFLLDLDEILAFQADRELVWIITAKQRFLATQSLRSLQDRLGEPRFQRVHRNAVVNLNHIRKMSPLSSQRWLITLSNGLEVVVSKRQAHLIRQILHW
ncbi:MAG TPA: LytTR family DNA-binding domain-containing protein [Verrucomicrobiae bacterium]|nr:LytTR family DNA-binding domain-containing protein [Verrucomicrobiae bacterium]